MVFPNYISTEPLPIHPLLQSFISHYVYRNFIISPEAVLEKKMPLRHVNSIDFFLGDPFDTEDCLTGEAHAFVRSTIRGPRTFTKYRIQLRRHFISFTVKFHPAGLYRLLQMPMKLFTDQAIDSSCIDQLPFREITERLFYAADAAACVSIIESYLLPIALQRSSSPAITDMIARNLIERKRIGPMTSIADTYHISLRQLERNFLREIGVVPKTYARMVRFEQLLQSRINKPLYKWAALAHDSNYHDQMHLVKEFRNFLDITPSSFQKDDFAF